MADDAGALLVRSGLVTARALDAARGLAARSGGTLGEHLVATGAIADDALTEFYRSRLLVPQVNPNSLAKLKTKIIQAIPADMAVELRAVPVAFDADGNLTVAMGDPSDRHAVDEIAFFTGNYVVRAVATQMQIAWCLAHYYGHVTELGQRLLVPRDDEAAPAAGSAPEAAPAARQRGDTARVEAARHRVLPPVTTPPPSSRPSIAVLDRAVEPTPAPDARPTIPDAEAARRAAGEPPAAPPDLEAQAAPIAPIARSRTASGEIRIGVPREVPPESSEPELEITISAGGPDEVTDPGLRSRRQRTDPPELAERGGEIAGRDDGPRTIADEPRVVIDLQALAPERPAPFELSGEIRLPAADRTPRPIDDEPSVRVALDDDAPAVIHDARTGMDAIVVETAADAESAPILLDRPRTAPPIGDITQPMIAVLETESSEAEVVLLESRRPKTTSERRRLARQTQVGLGAVGRAPSHGEHGADDRSARDTEVGGLPPGADMVASEIIMIAPATGTATEAPLPAQVTVTTDGDATIVTTAAPVGDTPDHDDVAPPPAPAREGIEPDPDDVTKPIDLGVAAAPPDDARTTDAFPTIGGPRIDHDSVDDGWGPPGTTIPPPLLAAVVDDSAPIARIPILDEDSTPIAIAPAITRTAPAAEAAATARDLEAAATRLVTVLRDIDQAKGRDEVIYNLIHHLGETHNRAAFFAVKNGELSVFSVRAPSVAQPRLALSLDLGSTFQDVVGTRLPYRGPVVDEPTRQYLAGLFGAAPAEMLVIPVAVRDRVVGVVYADGRRRQTFDDHYAIAARAAGLALERILKQRTNRPT